MYTIRTSALFDDWFRRLRDLNAKACISKRLRKMQDGNLGDWKSIGNGVSEIRIHDGPGYRMYFTRTGNEIILLLCGGDKSSQQRDINQAISMIQSLRYINEN